MLNGYMFYLNNTISIFTKRQFKGWGRKRSGRFASWGHRTFGGELILLEDGFIRSMGLGIEGSPSFSTVEDDGGMYYDATKPSKLENILNTYNFAADIELMQISSKALGFMKEYYISKYNNAPDVSNDFFQDDTKSKVLIIAQTASDASLEYGLAETFSTKQIVEDAIRENPNASVYIKIHPDVLNGKKKSDMNTDDIPTVCTIINEDVNPMSLLNHFDKVYTKTSGMGMEALLLGKEVACYGIPYYAGWGLTKDKQICTRRTRELKIEELFAGSYMLYANYFNPYSQKESNVIDTIQSIYKYKNLYRQNEGDLYFFGFSRWKRRFVKLFFPALKKNNIVFCASFNDGLKRGLSNASKIYIWGKKAFPLVEQYAQKVKIPLNRVEDGFIRSVSLGSDLTKAYSLVIDCCGIYFDSTQESDLEIILNTYNFDEKILDRAKKLQVYLIENKISKYNIHQEKELNLEGVMKGQRVVLVPGQVEDDASIMYGTEGMTNLELLMNTRKNAPDAYIVYKPHPDVLVGNRKGNIDTDTALKNCDCIITDASLDSVLACCDEVHTMTSLVGLEALIRGKKVYTYGLPFYAGWGLTNDTKKCNRRTMSRTLDELVAASFILYPRYINPKTNELCEIEALLEVIDKEKKRYNSNAFYRFGINGRNMISRKIQLLIKVLLGE